MSESKAKVTCLNKQCTLSKVTELSPILTIPFEIESKELCVLLSYFLHRAPNVSSVHSSSLGTDVHKQVFEDMLLGRHFKYQKFCYSGAKIEDELLKGSLFGEKICLKCKRFVCKRVKTPKNKPPETDLDCFLRHLRNAIAHGRVYCQHAGNRVLLVFEDENPSGNLSARIVCIKADLQHWRKTLEKTRKSRGELTYGNHQM